MNNTFKKGDRVEVLYFPRGVVCHVYQNLRSESGAYLVIIDNHRVGWRNCGTYKAPEGKSFWWVQPNEMTLIISKRGNLDERI